MRTFAQPGGGAKKVLETRSHLDRGRTMSFEKLCRVLATGHGDPCASPAPASTRRPLEPLACFKFRFLRRPLAEVRAGLKPPGTLKKAESIAAWWANEAEAAAEEAHRKQSLDGGTRGEIVSIAAVSEDGDQWVRCRAQGESEADLLRAFFDQVDAWTAEEAARVVPNHPDAWPVDAHFPVAHNAAFDLGYLWRRAIINRVPLPRWLPGPSARAGKEYGCTMTAWAGFGGRVSLDSLCAALGITSPKDDGIDGSKVYDAWQAGEVDHIAAYNLRDAQATAEVWHRLQGRGRI